MRDLCFKEMDFVRKVWDEHHNQLNKWGVQIHTPFEWLAYTTEELGELAKAICEFEYRDGSSRDIAKEAIQVATLALKIAEMYIFLEKSTNMKSQEEVF